MGDNKTAMRDPVFYRWHSMMDDLFVEFKKTLKPYTEDEVGLAQQLMRTLWEQGEIHASVLTLRGGGLIFVCSWASKISKYWNSVLPRKLIQL